MSATSKTFLEAARTALSFLENDLSFRVCEVAAPEELMANNQYSLNYRRVTGDGVEQIVRLSTAPCRGELDLEVARKWPAKYEHTINVYELWRLDPTQPCWEHAYGIYESFGNLEKLRHEYGVLAEMLRTSGRPFFDNDPSLWKRVGQLRHDDAEKQRRIEIEKKSDNTFKLRDWKSTVELLESLGDNLTQLERARLSYARKQLTPNA